MTADDILARRRRVYLVRHGHVDYFDATGTPLDPRHVSLSSQGISQVTALARHLAGTHMDRIVCSGMPRTHQTASLIAAQGEAPVAIEEQPALREIRAGRLREVPHDQRLARIADPYVGAQQADARFIGGDPFAEFESRVLTAWAELLADDGWRRLLIAAHDAVNRVILAAIAGGGRELWRALEQDPACLNIIDLDQSGGHTHKAMIRQMNFTAYDPIKAGVALTGMEQVYLNYR